MNKKNRKVNHPETVKSLRRRFWNSDEPGSGLPVSRSAAEKIKKAGAITKAHTVKRSRKTAKARSRAIANWQKQMARKLDRLLTVTFYLIVAATAIYEAVQNRKNNP